MHQTTDPLFEILATAHKLEHAIPHPETFHEGALAFVQYIPPYNNTKSQKLNNWLTPTSANTCFTGHLPDFLYTKI